jgi:mRNA interferase MazF
MAIQPGDVYWLQLDASDGEDARIPHPHVVVEVSADTVTLCAVTSNLRRVNMPGNVLLDAGEGNLPKSSVVEVSKAVTVDTAQLGVYIGTLSEMRLTQIRAGMRFVQTAFLTPKSDP